MNILFIVKVKITCVIEWLYKFLQWCWLLRLKGLTNSEHIVQSLFRVFLASVIRIGLDYDKEVHLSVKNFSPRQGFLRQWLICQRRWKRKFVFFYFIFFWKPQVGVLWRPAFLYEGMMLPRKLDLQRTSPGKKYCNHVIFSSMLKVLHQRSHGRGVNPDQWRAHSITNHIAPFL